MIRTKHVLHQILHDIVVLLCLGLSISIFRGIAYIACLATHLDIQTIGHVKILILVVPLALPLSRMLKNEIIEPLNYILKRDINECNGLHYPEGFYILNKTSDTTASSCTKIDYYPDIYTVCLCFTQANLTTIRESIECLGTQSWEIPGAFSVAGKYQLVRPKLSLASIIEAENLLREDQAAAFVYYVQKPKHSKDEDKDDRIIFIDLTDSNLMADLQPTAPD